jgi:hypothetical protein
MAFTSILARLNSFHSPSQDPAQGAHVLQFTQFGMCFRKGSV